MKISPVNPPKKFNPVTITLESEAEVAKLFAVFNFLPIINALGFERHWEELENANTAAGNPPIMDEFFHRNLQNMKNM